MNKVSNKQRSKVWRALKEDHTVWKWWFAPDGTNRGVFLQGHKYSWPGRMYTIDKQSN
jgi:uncharacterized protein YndB with AHSA1/START domain